MAKITVHTTQDAIENTSDRRPMLSAAHKGRRVQFLGADSIKNQWEGVILPSYDYELDTCDQAFPLSVSSCWKNEADKHSPKHLEIGRAHV